MSQKLVCILKQGCKERISTDSSFCFAPFGMTGVLKDERKRESAASPPILASVSPQRDKASFRTQQSEVRNLLSIII